MKNCTRTILKCICFLLIFTLIWCILSRIFAYKWNTREHVRDRHELFENLPKDSLDVFYLGSSPVNGGINPVVIYDEEGITGFNFGMTRNTAFIMYYQLRYALQHHTPKLVVLHLAGIHKEQSPIENMYYEASYRKLIENTLDWDMKMDILEAYKQEFNVDHTLAYLMPLLQYHDRWSDLNARDFYADPYHYENYQDFLMGTYMRSDVMDLSSYDLFANEKRELPIADLSRKYYDLIIDLCRENDIEIMAIMVPRMLMNPSYYRNVISYCQEKGIRLHYYEDLEALRAVGIDKQTCFYDVGHMNMLGQYYYSKALAHTIRTEYDLPDHRGDPAYSYWEDISNTYDNQYGQKVQELIADPSGLLPSGSASDSEVPLDDDA